MTIRTNTPQQLDNPPIPVQAKLAAAWTSLMFLVIYVDYFHLYKPGDIDEIRGGVIFEFDISATLMTIFFVIIAIPALMVMLSMTLPARVNRATNLVVASLYIPDHGVQRGRGVLGLGLLLRPHHRSRGAAPGLHPALRLDLAPHSLTVDARPRRTQPVADPDGTVGTRLRSEPPVRPRTSVISEPPTRDRPRPARGWGGRFVGPNGAVDARGAGLLPVRRDEELAGPRLSVPK